MPITESYLAQTKNLEEILTAIRHAQAPDKFTIKFLEHLGFQSKNDRTVIGMLKAMGFIDDLGAPRERYYQFLDEDIWARVLADGVREAYEDLFRINKDANTMTASQVKGKLKTLLQGSKGDAVLQKMTTTFTALCELADFSGESATDNGADKTVAVEHASETTAHLKQPASKPMSPLAFGYTINVNLPATRDQEVYNAIFRAIRENLS